MAYQFITLKTEDRVLTISLNRPPTNPLNGEFGLELFNAFSEAEQMDDVSVVVITSALEKAFIAGADIKEMAAHDVAEADTFSKLLQGANNILNRMKKSRHRRHQRPCASAAAASWPWPATTGS